MNYERTTLQSGLRLLTTHMPGMRSASIGFFFTVGSRYEADPIGGISHFIEHMLFKGSRHYPTARLLSEAIEGVGGIFNGSTGKEITSYTARVPGEQLPLVMNVHYRTSSLVIGVAGNIDHAQVIKATERIFSDWETRGHPGWKESFSPRDTLPVGMIRKETEQTNICLATLGAAYSSPDYFPILLINAILGDGMSSRLFQSIREEQGLAYDIGSYFNSYYETGSLVVSAGVDPLQTKPAIEAIIHELNQLCKKPVPGDELERVKAYVRGGVLLGLEGTQQVASWLGSQECLRNKIIDIDEIVAHIDAVTSQDIQRVAQFCFAPTWRRLAVIGPDDPQQAEYFGKLLKSV